MEEATRPSMWHNICSYTSNKFGIARRCKVSPLQLLSYLLQGLCYRDCTQLFKLSSSCSNGVVLENEVKELTDTNKGTSNSCDQGVHHAFMPQEILRDESLCFTGQRELSEIATNEGYF